MTPILLFTGSGGPGIASAAAATALRSAEAGTATLLLSLGPPPALEALLGTALGSGPAAVAPRLDALAIDGLGELTSTWQAQRARMPPEVARIGADELPAPPGIELAFGLLRLRDLAPRYGLVVLDAGPHDLLLRALAAPDGLRWAIRLLFGLDRGPGRSAASLDRALLPTTFIPSDMLNSAQSARVEAERLRELLIAPGAAALCYVLRPDAPALAEARIAVPALQLHGLAVASLAIGPLLPGELGGTPLATLATQQSDLEAEVAAIWPSRPQHRFTLAGDPAALAALRERVLARQAHPAWWIDLPRRAGEARPEPARVPQARPALGEQQYAAPTTPRIAIGG